MADKKMMMYEKGYLSDLNLRHGSKVYLFDTSSMSPKMITDNHNQMGDCSGTESSFNNYAHGSQSFKDAIINSGSAVAESGQQHGVSGTRDSFNNHGSSNSGNSQEFTGAIINSGQNSGNYGGSGSAGASEQQHGGGGTRDLFNNVAGCHDFSGWHYKHWYESGIVEEVSRKINNHAYVSGSGVVPCSGTDSSFNNYGHGPQSFKDAIINSGKNSGNFGGSGSAVVESGQQHGVSGFRESFNNYRSGSNWQDLTRAKINGWENSGNE